MSPQLAVLSGHDRSLWNRELKEPSLSLSCYFRHSGIVVTLVLVEPRLDPYLVGF